MSQSSNLSPRREHGDLSRLEGIEILDESLNVLFGAQRTLGHQVSATATVS